jgi:hypothetical protein
MILSSQEIVNFIFVHRLLLSIQSFSITKIEILKLQTHPPTTTMLMLLKSGIFHSPIEKAQ